MCVSPDLIPVMDTCVRPFLCCTFRTSLRCVLPVRQRDAQLLAAAVFHCRWPTHLSLVFCLGRGFSCGVVRARGSSLRILPLTSRTQKERKKTDNPREGWEDGTPPPHRDFKERGVMR